jgi:hypothetical protein
MPSSTDAREKWTTGERRGKSAPGEDPDARARTVFGGLKTVDQPWGSRRDGPSMRMVVH